MSTGVRATMRPLAGAIGLLAAAAVPALAQVPADASWRTIESAHFRVTFESDLEPLARHAAASAERAYAALSVLVAEPPDDRIDLIVADNIDLSNGSATPFPSNRILIYARPPTDVLELQYARDWIELVVTHELAHVFHLDVTGRFGHVLRAIFGRAPLPWPFFPAVGVPTWNVEGLAVVVESALTGWGRVHGSYNEMVVRTAALAGTLDEYDRLGSSSARWPGGSRAYIYGSLFMDYLARRFGADAARRIVASTAGAVLPPPLWFGRTGSSALDITFRNAYRDWEREVVARSDSLATVITAQGLTTSEPLTDHRALAQYPRFSPDGSRIAYAAHDWRSPPQLRVIDAATGSLDRSIRTNLAAPASWLTPDRLVTASVEFVDRFRIFSDLHIVGAGERRITRRARLEQPDVSPDGLIAAIENDGGTSRVVLVDIESGTVRPITELDPAVHYALPRFSPGGDRIAVQRWHRGAHDIVVLDTAGSAVVVTDGFGVNAAPVWSPDGRWILFGSDRSGIPNLYAVDAAAAIRSAANGGAPAPGPRQVTNVLTGAFQPDVSPDGRWIAFAAYHHDGFRIERMPFDTAAWRTPAPTGFAASIAPRTAYGFVDDRPLLDSVAVAFASADTTSGPVRRYRALRSLRPYFWAPQFGYDELRDELYLGAFTWGSDLVGRHSWGASIAVETGSGRTQGFVGYTFAGLPTIPGAGLHPTISAFAAREWDEFFRVQGGDMYADEREDIVGLGFALTRPRWRTSSVLGLTAERVLRSRYLYNATPDVSLIDPDDDLWGLRASAATARYDAPPLSISRQSGYLLQIAVRQRWDSDPRTFIDDPDTLLLDGGYRELTTSDAAYITLPLPGFARHVLALRFSGLLRDGPGASLSSIGGVTGSGVNVAGLGSGLGGSSLLLPVRGFPRGVRAGTDAWTATAEYRFPLALFDSPLRPFFFDRLSGALFADAGHAWCDDDFATRFTACTSSSPRDPPLLAAGAEATLLMSFLGFSAPVRTGIGIPIRGPANARARAYILVGYAF